MKYRKVGSGSLYNGVVSSRAWTKSSDSGPSGCVTMRVKSHRRLPTKIIENDNEERTESADTVQVAPKYHNIVEITHEDTYPSPSNETRREETVEVPPSPEAKSLKYDIGMLVAPPKAVVQHYFDAALHKQNETNEPCDQLELIPSKLLSLEDVLLPALVHQESEALRRLQRKIQRDAPQFKHIVMAGRIAVKKCLIAAVVAAQQSRHKRKILDDQREAAMTQQRQQQRDENRQARAQDLENRRAEEVRRNELEKQKETREMKKRYSPNQELWREVAYLMTESSKLEREGRLWADAEALLDKSENELKAREEEKSQKIDEEMQIETVSMEHEEASFDGKLPASLLESSLQDVISSSHSFQAALNSLTDLMTTTDKLRKDVYQRYSQDHQFEGYRGVHDPMGLIRILSQDCD
jgi:hypothetical protein